jgi:hypothetical protein
MCDLETRNERTGDAQTPSDAEGNPEVLDTGEEKDAPGRTKENENFFEN